ncbi:DUF2062 domain-containing protein [Stappia stellulata]|uniref:DUF2062 domain-containing protein n=1 Tax=Stappia TaxID=152161 RepID=UPI001CD1D525|nr:DUF2062 domain-containing protein [Stappia stellulata]MCA1240959.1 DUF2062 domain-containing protein [Stappia stellulata]
MLFKRRTSPNHLERLRVAVWPRHSFARSARYFSKRVLRLTASPNAIALGFAAGVFASITPFIGLHFVLSFVIAFIIGGNMLAAALGTAIGNPLTFPLIWASTYKLGAIILYGEAKTLDHKALDRHLEGGFFERSLDTLLPLIKPMLVGAMPLGLVAGVVSYFLVFYSVRTYQRSRRVRLAARRGLASANPRKPDLDAQP